MRRQLQRLPSRGRYAVASSREETVKMAAGISPAGLDLGSVEHVIFLMLENRSFDHYFGSLGGVRGFDDHAPDQLGAFAQAWPHGPRGRPSALLPFRLNTLRQKAECTYDLSHAWPLQHACWNEGAMDQFVSAHTSSAGEGRQYGTMTMGYYEESDLPFHYQLAKQFTVCDGYHCSVFGPTHPNRLFHLSATNDPDGVAGGPIITTNSDPNLEFTCTWDSMPEQLSANNISWKMYNPAGPLYQPHQNLSLSVSDNILLYFQAYQDPTSTLYRNAFGYNGPDTSSVLPGPAGTNDFAHDVLTDQLPTVSWLIPGLGFDEHPAAPPVLGEWYTQQVLDTLLANPAIWASTVLFITFDENDGFFDHVPPPTPPPNTPGEYLSVDPLPGAAGGIAGPIGLGMRVPMIVVSPFSAGGYVCSDTFDHTSQLRFLETLLGVTVPNLSAWRRSVTGDLTAALPVLTQPVTSAPILPTVSTKRNKRPLRECLPGAFESESSGGIAPYRIPRHQVMPTQGPGTLIPTPT